MAFFTPSLILPTLPDGPTDDHRQEKEEKTAGSHCHANSPNQQTMEPSQTSQSEDYIQRMVRRP